MRYECTEELIAKIVANADSPKTSTTAVAVSFFATLWVKYVALHRDEGGAGSDADGAETRQSARARKVFKLENEAIESRCATPHDNSIPTSANTRELERLPCFSENCRRLT